MDATSDASVAHVPSGTRRLHGRYVSTACKQDIGQARPGECIFRDHERGAEVIAHGGSPRWKH
jgi:hypothetical protein